MGELARWRDVDPTSICDLSRWAEVVNGIYLETKAERGGSRYGILHLQLLIDNHHGDDNERHDVLLKAPAVTTWRCGALPSRGQVDAFVGFLWACGVDTDHLDAWREGVLRMRRVRDNPRRRIVYRLVQPAGSPLGHTQQDSRRSSTSRL